MGPGDSSYIHSPTSHRVLGRAAECKVKKKSGMTELEPIHGTHSAARSSFLKLKQKRGISRSQTSHVTNIKVTVKYLAASLSSDSTKELKSPGTLELRAKAPGDDLHLEQAG